MSWSVAVVVIVVCLALLGTLWTVLTLLTRSISAVADMCTGVTRSLLGQSEPGDDGIQFEEQVGSSQNLFEAMPGWQYWGKDDSPLTQADPFPHLRGNDDDA